MRKMIQDSRNRSALRFLERRKQQPPMNRQNQPPKGIVACVYLGVVLTLLSVGMLLFYNGIHQGIIHQEIVCRPPPGKGGGMAAYGARAVKIGIGLAALGTMFMYAAGLLISGWYKARGRGRLGGRS